MVSRPRSPLEWTEAALGFALFLIVAVILYRYTRYALVAPPSFDGGMNLNVAWSFMHRHGYGFLYNEYFPFPAETDGPFIIPAGILMWLGGIAPITTQGVNLAYLFGAAFVIWLTVARATGSRLWGLAGTVLALSTPGMSSYALDGFGEIPTLFWVLMALLVISRGISTDGVSIRRIFFGGLLLGVAYLTKIVALIMIVPLVIVIGGLLLLRSLNRFSRIAWLVAGFVLPIIAWEVFRLWELGGTSPYVAWWRSAWGDIAWQSGASESVGTFGLSLVVKGWRNVHILARDLGAPNALSVVLYLIAPWITAIAFAFRRWRQSSGERAALLLSITAICGAYFVWWLFLTPRNMPWLRHILDGIVFQQLLVAITVADLVGILLGAVRTTSTRVVSAAGLTALLAIESTIAANGERFSKPLDMSGARGDLAMAQTLRALPADAVLFGLGWWKNPVLALFSQRTMMNFDHWDSDAINALPHKYLVLDYYAKGLAKAQIEDEALSSSIYSVVADGSRGTIYRLEAVRSYRPFLAQERTSKELAPGFDFASHTYAATRGIYPRDGRIAWAKPDAALLLRRTDETRFSMSIEVPPSLFSNATGQHRMFRLQITSARCLDATILIDSPGEKAINLPLSCAATPGALEITLHFDGHMPFPPTISGDSRMLAYSIKSARLSGP
jgi:hypothetical protein